MEKIDLNMRLADWISKPVPSPGLCVAVLKSSGRDLTIRDFLKMDRSVISSHKYIGPEKIREFQRTLSFYGLKMGMTDEDIAEYEGKPAQQPTTSGYITCEMIDWEQRRWELSTGLLIHYPELTFVSAIQMAEGFIEYYKNPDAIGFIKKHMIDTENEEN